MLIILLVWLFSKFRKMVLSKNIDYRCKRIVPIAIPRSTIIDIWSISN